MRFIKMLPLLMLAATANAAETELNTQQIETLLKGNSAAGVHFAGRTTQYFSESGLTLWMKEGDAKPSEGKWKAENNKYCSDFGSGWGCYKIINDEAQQIYYFMKDDFRAPFIVKPGYQFGH
ncbi:hypothetical protein [Aliamphritea ceti]|uniref:hypothetical protein n=1 Tax=Aliamphritea ceti TaxID=1524258 RepID=UPI0021C38319|nr:hypothetical protein [Aliamphritea ceti]